MIDAINHYNYNDIQSTKNHYNDDHSLHRRWLPYDDDNHHHTPPARTPRTFIHLKNGAITFITKVGLFFYFPVTFTFTCIVYVYNGVFF